MKFNDPKIEQHHKALYAALFNTYDLKDIVKYISDKTYLNGARFSFKDHEFQIDVISDTSHVVNVQKCAQVGMSEIMARYVTGLVRTIPYFSAILTMPYAGDATKFVKTRVNPIITESPDLREALDPNLDNTEVKGIGSGLLYARGCSGETSALSVPADLLVHDEVDRSDPAVLAQYQSRLKHGKWKLTRNFGTPTMDGVGIALHMTSSMRKHHMVKCNLCNHHFVPNYHEHIHIPGYSGDKKDITKYLLPTINWKGAVLLCPKCGRTPSLQPAYREWVVENINDNHDASGYYIIPFSVPNIPTINNVGLAASLVRESTVYDTWTEFCNQALGETNNDDNEQLTLQEIQACKHGSPLDSTELHCMGVDLGLTCNILIGRLTLAGQLLVVHKERCKLGELEEVKKRLQARYRVIISVFDAFPYTEMILRLQKHDKNLYGGVFAQGKVLQTYSIKHADPKPKDLKEGGLPIHTAEIKRNLNFDEVMYLFKSKSLVWAATNSEEDTLFEAHCSSVKRTKEFDREGGVKYNWVKPSDGNDHYFFALGYLHVACRLLPTATGASRLLPSMPIAFKLATPTPKEIDLFGHLRN